MDRAFDVETPTGLSDEEVARRLAQEGYNDLPSSKPRSLLAIMLGVLHQPMFLLLIGGGVIYMALGDMQEALALLFFVFVVVGITIYQERKTERALFALRNLSSPRARVIRDRRELRIPGREVVHGDIVLLSEGDRVPADAAVLMPANLYCDESLLTGESVPVRKAPWDGRTDIARPGGDNLPFVYSGTVVVRGQGVTQVLATGSNTEIGRIGKALETLKTEETPLQRETGRIVRAFAAVGLSLCAVVVIVYGLTRGNWLDGFLAGIALAMAVLPEEFAVVLVVFLALGAWRISRNRVLTRSMPAIEALGETTVLCVDKTGTITLNRMEVTKLFAKDVGYGIHLGGPLPEAFHTLVEFSILASQRDPFDPMEKALKEFGSRYLAKTEHLHANWTLVREYPLSEKLLAMSHVWRSPDGIDYTIAAKGAPEAIADLCHLDKQQEDLVIKQVAEMADEGLRVLGVARAYFRQTTPLPTVQHEFTFEFLGLIGLTDPVRPSVSDAVAECYSAGIRVMMITGDYPGTARHVGRQIGLRHADKVVTGEELDGMPDQELIRQIGDVSVFARVVPEEKLQLVTALKAHGEVVAMTGDGVNDAPALKAANIGIAMGGRGTDVAREAAALVLLDDDFSSIVRAVRLGRKIFDSLKKAMAYILAIHIPIAGMSLVPVLLRWPLVLLPLQIAFLELIIDPACSIVFESEPEEADVMDRPPRDPRKPLFDRRTLGISLLQGMSVFVVVLAIFGISKHRMHDDSVARAMAFTTLVTANLALILANRSWTRTLLPTLKTPNTAFWLVSGGAFLFLGLVLYVPELRGLFHFSTLGSVNLGISLAGGAVSVAWFELLKVFLARRQSCSTNCR